MQKTPTIDKLEQTLAKMIEVKSPSELAPGSIDIDVNMARLADNLRVLDNAIYIAGVLVAQYDYQYNTAVSQMSIALSADDLKSMGVVASDKFKYIKHALAEESMQLEMMRAKYRWCVGQKETFMEWINVFKKVRKLGE